jgi:hypothetical protein
MLVISNSKCEISVVWSLGWTAISKGLWTFVSRCCVLLTSGISFQQVGEVRRPPRLDAGNHKIHEGSAIRMLCIHMGNIG